MLIAAASVPASRAAPAWSPSPAAAAFGVVQSFGATSGGGSASLAASPSTTTTAGDLLVAVVRDRGSNALAPVSRVSDPAGDTWVRAAGTSRKSNGDGEIWYAAVAASVSTAQAVTVTVGGTAPTKAEIALTVLEVAGASAAPLDRTATNSGTAQPASTGTTAPTAHATEIAIADVGWNGTATPTTHTTGYTTTAVEQATVRGAGVGEQAAWQALGAIGSQAYAATLGSGSSGWTGLIATFAATQASITGHVTDSFTNAAIVGATVSYNGGTSTTDGTGAYSMGPLPPGPYTLSASATGYTASQPAQVTVSSGTTQTQDFALAPLPGAISGTVTDAATGQAIAGATVSYSGAGASGSTTAAADGSYTFSPVGEGDYTVTASAPGYPAQTVSRHVAPGATARADLALAASPGTITGTVTDSSGQPIAGATVSYKASTAPTPHVLVIVEENRGYQSTLGSCSADPYLCSLASTYASASGWTGIGHPSQPNYLALTTGGTQGCTSDSCFTTLGVPSLGGQLTAAGVPWAAYMESMPTPCYTMQWAPGTTGGGALYAEKHDPFVVAGDVLNNGCASHVLPYPSGGLAATLNGAGAPDFAWVTPNLQDDMHTGSVKQGDAWLQANLAPILSSQWFTAANATVIVTMDEHSNDSTGCCVGAAGGSVPMVVVSHNAGGKGVIAAPGDHYGLLRTIEEAYGIGYLGSASDSANGDLLTLFGGGTGGTTTTDSSGAYTLSNVVPGMYTLTASASGYTSQAVSVTVNPDASTLQNFAMSP